MKLTPLSDQGVLASFVTEEAALAFAAALREAQWPEIVDVVPAYVSVAVYHDPARIGIPRMVERLQAIPQQRSSAAIVGCLHVIPCCYELGPDLARVADHCQLNTRDVIRLHTSVDFTVYAVGFCPGFPYMGYLPDVLCGIPRLPSPRLRVEPGSVGVTGRQTGIYPLPRPGGWNLIGLTPLQLVDVADGYFPLRAGDRVRFQAINRSEYENRRGMRITDCESTGHRR